MGCRCFFIVFFGGKGMQYKQNVHVLLPVEIFEELRGLGHKLNVSRSKLVRIAVVSLLKKYERKGKKSESI
jgi:metal-responsive CopG/Arc/MetJ family transcriptional regulator